MPVQMFNYDLSLRASHYMLSCRFFILDEFTEELLISFFPELVLNKIFFIFGWEDDARFT